jgi:hypothetical protein
MKPSEREKMLAKARKMRQRKQSTYDEVPSGKLASRVQKMKDALGGKKGAKVTSGTVFTFKDTGSGKGADPKGLFKPKKTKQADTKAAATKRKATDTMTAAEKKAKSNANAKPAATGKVSFGTAFANARKAGMKTFTWNGNKYTTQTKAEAAKKKTPTAPKPRPKKKTPTSEGNTVAGVKGTKKAAPKKAPSTKSRDKDGLGTKSTMPKGAIRKYTGKYNNKTERIRNIGGKTYVFKK